MEQIWQELAAFTTSDVIQLILMALGYFFVFLYRRHFKQTGDNLMNSMHNVLDVFSKGKQELKDKYSLLEQKMQQYDELEHKLMRMEKAMRVLIEEQKPTYMLIEERKRDDNDSEGT